MGVYSRMTQNMIKIEVFNQKEVAAFLNKKSKQTVKRYEEGVNEATLFLEGEIKESIARGKNAERAFDTGNFMRNTTSSIDKGVGVVSNNTEYAQAIEYGHMMANGRFYPSRPHFRNTLFVNKDKIITFLKNKIKQVEN